MTTSSVPPRALERTACNRRGPSAAPVKDRRAGTTSTRLLARWSKFARRSSLAVWAALAAGCFVAASVPATARAGDIEEFETARAAYEARDYSRAVFYFEELVGGDAPRLASSALVTEARKYLGAAYLFVGRRDAARQQFERLLRTDPRYTLDPLSFPTEVQELFESVRARLELEAQDAMARASLQARALAAEQQVSRLVAFVDEGVEVAVPNSRWLAAIPFGVGQFQNGNDGLGWTLLASDIALAAVALGSTVWHQSLVGQVAYARSRGAFEAVAEGNRLLEIAATLDWAALSALGTLAISGILEAQLTFVPARRIREQRVIPPALRGPTIASSPWLPPSADVTALVGPASITLRIAF